MYTYAYILIPTLFCGTDDRIIAPAISAQSYKASHKAHKHTHTHTHMQLLPSHTMTNYAHLHTYKTYIHRSLCSYATPTATPCFSKTIVSGRNSPSHRSSSRVGRPRDGGLLNMRTHPQSVCKPMRMASSLAGTCACICGTLAWR
jgi:hypothetical protein